MIILRSPHDLQRVTSPALQLFLRQRFRAICEPEPYDPDEHGFFIVLEPGDTSENIESATGYAPMKSLFSDAHYGDPEFMPDFEYLEGHGEFFEAVYILNDGGFAVVLIVPKLQGIDEAILALRTEFAE
ncbi:MAG: hypothetical protein KJ725_13515 [Gammaproteobacteria bacterium]|nr:hypothetical protein [Gammaproteobacteria bacterium]